MRISYSAGHSSRRLDHRAFDADILEQFRGLNLGELQLVRYVDVYWRGFRRDKKDFSERERDHRPDHLLLVFDRYLVFLERGSSTTASYASSAAVLDAAAIGGAIAHAHQLPALHLRALPVIDLSAVPPAPQPNSKDPNSRPAVSAERQTVLLCPIVELAAVVKVVSDARGSRLDDSLSADCRLLDFKIIVSYLD